MTLYKVGIDIGSTTAKIVALDPSGKPVYTNYVRHQARVKDCIADFCSDLRRVVFPDVCARLVERLRLCFRQRRTEVFRLLAAAR